MILEAINRMIVEAQISREDLLRKEEGQGMVEYGLIIALVAVVAGATLLILGERVRDLFTAVTGQF